MYSLIIANQKTLESFHLHRPLFVESLEKGQVGYCRWIESGDTIDTAVPELRGMTHDKKEWRAVIVHMYDEGEMRLYETKKENPFDFVVNSKKHFAGKQQLESKIPLVHLTHLLGGVPVPEIGFEAKVSQEADKLPYTYYEVKKDKEAEKEYQDLIDKYDYDGIMPSEIWLISPRKKIKTSESVVVRKAWGELDEMKSSDFCRRNRYPAQCRFMVYDYETSGPVVRDADYFNFWLSILLLSINYIEPSALQAYRLYSFSADINNEKLDEVLEENLDRIAGLKRNISERIERYSNKRKKHPHNRKLDFLKPNEHEVEDMQKYVLEKDTACGIDAKQFKLYAKNEQEEMESWRSMNTKAKEELAKRIKSAERQLNYKADGVRLSRHVDRDLVRSLDQFEMEDFEERLSGLYESILQEQKQLPDTTIMETAEEKAKAEEITSVIRTRISENRALGVALNVDFLILLFGVPVMMFLFSIKDWQRLLNVFFVLLCVILIVLLAMLFVLIANKIRLIIKINQYNDLLNARLHQLKANEKTYNEFVINIIHYSRGKDYLRVLAEKHGKEDSELQKMVIHRKSIDEFEALVEKWGKAFMLDIAGAGSDWNIAFLDITVPPYHNVAYSLESKDEYEITLSGSSDKLISPFGFVEKLNVNREELMENAGYSN